MDASIGFETLRPTNAGPAFNDSLSFFQSFVSDMVSSTEPPYFRQMLMLIR